MIDSAIDTEPCERVCLEIPARKRRILDRRRSRTKTRRRGAVIETLDSIGSRTLAVSRLTTFHSSSMCQFPLTAVCERDRQTLATSRDERFLYIQVPELLFRAESR